MPNKSDGNKKIRQPHFVISEHFTRCICFSSLKRSLLNIYICIRFGVMKRVKINTKQMGSKNWSFVSYVTRIRSSICACYSSMSYQTKKKHAKNLCKSAPSSTEKRALRGCCWQKRMMAISKKQSILLF